MDEQRDDSVGIVELALAILADEMQLWTERLSRTTHPDAIALAATRDRP